MTQRELNRAVARATGETIDTVSRRGFTLQCGHAHAERNPLVLDWDRRQPRRLRLPMGRRRRAATA